MPQSKRVFLSAEWRNLVMLNYAVDPGLLNQYVPPGTSLDSFQGKTYISLVGFRFCRTKVLGHVSVPFHTDFDEVNLRFYVCRQDGGKIRRGVVFVAEVVPRRVIAATARLVYGENYKYAPMRHRIEIGAASKSAEFQWQVRGTLVRAFRSIRGLANTSSGGNFGTVHHRTLLGIFRSTGPRVHRIPRLARSVAGMESHSCQLPRRRQRSLRGRPGIASRATTRQCVRG